MAGIGAGRHQASLLLLFCFVCGSLGTADFWSDSSSGSRSERPLHWFFERNGEEPRPASESVGVASPSSLTLVRHVRSAIPTGLLAASPQCAQDLKSLCPKFGPDTDDLSVLECLLAKIPATVSIDCQHVVHSRVMKIMNNKNLEEAAEPVCKQDVPKLNCPHTDQTGQLLSCVLDHIEDINSQCQAFFQRVERVAFGDFRVFSKFMTDCADDIEIQKCGRLQTDSELPSQQGTLNCLQGVIDNLSTTCRHEVLHLSVFQGDNIHLDRKLSAACSDDQRRFCPDVQPGSGKVYKCLLHYRLDRSMSQACQDQLGKYQKLISQNYRVSRGLVRACKDDIRMYHCRRAPPDDKDIRLAKILLCLEGFIRNGSKVSRDCQMEMMEHRKMLMEDYRLSPEIVTGCSEDIKKYCNSLEAGGKTIHCLMEHARPKRRRDKVSAQCQRALEGLVKEVDAGEDWRVDPVLREACKPVVDVACQEVRGGDARVMNCLMDKLGTPQMTEACESALLQIQYFVARDFKLDPQLYKQCRDDAVHLCHAKKVWYDDSGQMDPERGPLVLPCLYRNAYQSQKDQGERKLKKQCLEEVRRVMQQRAMSVDLLPDVEEACLDDLATYCFEKTGRGQETLCLQDNLEKLRPHCREVISNFTETQAAHVDLNPVVATACKAIMQRHCEAEWRSGRDEGDMMDCLIKHKNEMDVREDYKCRAAIEHFQLISIKNYHFTYKFKEACRSFVIRFCPSSKTKYDVVSCLSEVVRNDTINESRHSIPKECRQQLKAQLFQQRENLDYDPKLKKACSDDIAKVCSNVPSGAGKLLECLRINRKFLNNECHKAVFKIEQELAYNSVDYSLTINCKSMINTFCLHEPEQRILNCLKQHRDDAVFNEDCRKIVIHRMIEQNTDYRLNPDLRKSCQPDIKKFCKNVILEANPDEELDGKVINCLKVKFRAAKLRKECENEMELVLRDAALNYQLNPLLSRMCENDIKQLCGTKSEQESEGYAQGAVEECLKDALRNGQIIDKACRIEILSLIDEGHVDIHVDPLLYKACALDLRKFCSDTEQGAGRLIQCLTLQLPVATSPLQQDCRDKLSQRLELFSFAKKEAAISMPRTMGELYHHVQTSPSSSYFMLVFAIVVGVTFMCGTFFGRVTNRRMAHKNK
ncbi:Golgi apparatus protein 1 [Thrips palmi]|uniref:Golgi apparatus protein 1 n=1 Tax=Thrips palmi TaxID=161013 RepID=A0A6P8YIV8_THRPL|nr:Golgi apparatus protein 1 [Thrips palmi]XP_034236976.1 Golgi apparatus protein 1 [Thrips palmi]